MEKISNYQIIKEIGSGGMGKVYQALDERLDRRVALKILPSEIASDRKRFNRFLQEARLAANLNHPNICTIYEVNETCETPFLTMELVEGDTLEEKIDRKSLDFREILRLAIQIADALDEAHQNGIIHRDIKASNIIVNHRGQVKVLDFGLAKTISEEVSEQAVTRARTEDGMLVGTIQYMSPEQALGKKLDGRTDLWSLGVLLYEAVCGKLPFKAATQAGTFDEILHKHPDSPADLNAEIPVELEHIILKLLEKDRDLRYQTAADLLVDLKRLVRGYSKTEDVPGTANLSGATRFSAQVNALPSARKNKRPLLFFGVILILILGGLGLGFYYFGSPQMQAANFQNAQILSLTNLGKVSDAAISPDGKYVVYATDEGAKQTLWLKQTATGSNVQIIPPSEVVYQGLAVSPDSNWVYYNLWDRKSVGQIFRIPVLGGAAQKVVHDCMPGISISPDGQRLVFTRSVDEPRQILLMNIRTDGTDEKRVETKPDVFFYSPEWSPDGKSIAYGSGAEVDGKIVQQIMEVAAEGGESKVVFESLDADYFLNEFVWLPDKSGFLSTVIKKGQTQPQIWKINFADSGFEQITKGVNGYSHLSITSDGQTLLSLQADYLLSVWVVPGDDPGQAKRVTEGRVEGIGISWTPDDRIIYSSNISGGFELWSMNADGSSKKQLTFDNHFKINPCVSGDGKYIFVNVEYNQNAGRARMDIDGKNLKLLDRVWRLNCSQAAPFVFYMSAPSPSKPQLWRESIEQESARAILSKDMISYAISPDAKKVAYVYWNKTSKGYGFEIFSFADNSIEKFELPVTAVQKFGDEQFALQWTADGKNLTFVNNEEGYANVWLLPLNGGKPKRITNFNDNFIYTFAWSRDGKKLAVARGTATVDAVLLQRK